MTTIPGPLLAHLEGEATTICQCWRVTRSDGVVLGFTDHDLSLTVDGTLFRPRTGFTGSEARSSLGLAIDTSDIEGVLSADEITDADIDGGLYDGARVETLMANWAAPAQFARLRRATIGKIERRDGRFIAELESATAPLDRPSGRTIRRSCDAQLGDARCGVVLAGPTFTGSGAVVSIAPDGGIVASGLSGFADGWFVHGVLIWTSGAQTGRTARVLSQARDGTNARLGFWMPVGSVTVGTTFSIVAGCDKGYATCRAKFGNGLNFRGFPHLPGNDAAYAYANGQAVFDGGALVP